MKRIGILGGMGPQATIDLYQKIVKNTHADCDQAHIPTIIDSYPQIEDRTAFILGRGSSPLPKLLESGQRLLQAGAELVIMPCNTAHYFAEEIRASLPIPLLHIAEETVVHLKKHYQRGTKIALLATEGTIKSRIYHNALSNAGYQLLQPDDALQQHITACIYQGAKKGVFEPFVPILRQTMAEIPADIFLLACTELPLYLPWLDGFATLDPTEILAQHAVYYAQHH